MDCTIIMKCSRISKVQNRVILKEDVASLQIRAEKYKNTNLKHCTAKI